MQVSSFDAVVGNLSGHGHLHAGHDHTATVTPTAATPTATATPLTIGGVAVETGTATHDHSAHTMADGTVMAGGDHDHGHGGHIEPEPPSYGDPRFLQGSVGPYLSEGEADTLIIPDGDGFFGLSGREQNDGDKEQNNYSVTDANYSNTLGLLAANPDTGELLTYNQHTQMYNAAGYIETYAPDVYAQLVENQNAGKGTVLGAAAKIFGLVETTDPALEGVDTSTIPMTIPGTNVEARAMVVDPKDGTGQDWARMHHAQASWVVFKSLIDAGLDFETANVLSGDDAISGSGRLNGYNNQNGDTGFNEDEAAVFRLGAKVEQRTGIPVIQLMMAGHAHTGIDESTMTNPRINKIIGFPEGSREATPERAAAVRDALLSGDALENGLESLRKSQKFNLKNERFFSDETLSAGGIIDIVRAEDEAIAATLPPEVKNNNGGGGNDDPPVGVENATRGGTGQIVAADGSIVEGGGAAAPDASAIPTSLRNLLPGNAIAGAFSRPVGLENAIDANGNIIDNGALDFSSGLTDANIRSNFRDAMDQIINRMIFTALEDSVYWSDEDGDGEADKGTLDKLVIDSAGRLQMIIDKAMEDGTISDAEADAIRGAARASTQALIDEALADGSISADELASIQDAAAAADSEALDQAKNRGPSELDRLVDEASADGVITEDEKAEIFALADDSQRAVLEEAFADGELSVEERDTMLQAADDSKRAADRVGEAALKAALEDGEITAEERTALEGDLTEEQLAALDGVTGEDGAVDAEKAAELIDSAEEGTEAGENLEEPEAAETDAPEGDEGKPAEGDAPAAGDAPAEDAGGDEAPADEAPAEDAPADDAPAEDAPAGDGGNDEAPAGDDAPPAEAPPAPPAE